MATPFIERTKDNSHVVEGVIFKEECKFRMAMTLGL